MELKNLFEYAPKELTQDGFIRWVFENYGHPDLHDLCADFIKFLTAFDDSQSPVNIDDKNFVRLNSWSQVCHMDVGCDFWFAGDKEKGFCSRYLVIEDKTNSCEHNQLETYSRTIEQWDKNAGRGSRAIKVFYKTTPVEEDEANRVKNAGWRLIPLDEIVCFWSKYKDHPNVIVQFYAKHIMQIGASSKAKTKPKENDIVAWLSYFRKTIVPLIKKKQFEIETYCDSTFRGFAYLDIYPKGREDERTPYLEIRSRDLLGDSFEARILRYGKRIDDDSFFKLRDCINERGGLFKANRGKKRIKQAGVTKKSANLSSVNDDRLIESLAKCIEEYLKIIEEWRKRQLFGQEIANEDHRPHIP
jgi:hypothetical protein